MSTSIAREPDKGDDGRSRTDHPEGPAARGRTAGGSTAADAAGHAPVSDAGRSDRPARERDDRPAPPERPGPRRHLLGILLGLLVTPIGLALLASGAGRLAETARAATEPGGAPDLIGIVLLLLGVVVLVTIALLGTWSPALPITGGLAWALIPGLVLLVAPWLLTDLIASLPQQTQMSSTEAATALATVNGYLVVTGALLVAAGVEAARGRRKGRRWAEAAAAADAGRAGARHR